MFLDNLFSNVSIKNVSGLTNELKCIYINTLFKREKKSIVVVCNSLYEANKVFETLKVYNPNTLFFPMDDFLTSEVLAVSPDLKATRLETLSDDSTVKIIVTNLMGYLRYLPTKDVFKNSYIKIKPHDTVDIKSLEQKLFNIGYSRETIVDKTGTMAIRGFVVDVFPTNTKSPIRIEFWGDEVESIRQFDVDTQLKSKDLDSVTIMPNSEFIISADVDKVYKQRDLIKFGSVCNITEYAGDALIVYDDYHDLKNAYTNLLMDITEYCESSDIDSSTAFMHNLLELKAETTVDMSRFDTFNDAVNYDSYELDDNFTIDTLEKQLDEYIKKYKYIIIGLSNRYNVNKVLERIKDAVFTDLNNIYTKRINVVIFPFSSGFIFNDLVVISEKELFHQSTTHVAYKTNFTIGSRIKNISKLAIGDYVVHKSHGIGRYCGIKTIAKNGLDKDYLQIEYKDGDKLYVPVERIDLITKYSSKEGFQPRINKLGSSEWQATKLKARNRAKDIADQLLKLYALREMQEGFAFSKDSEEQALFESQFPYDETVDQIKVIDEIKRDMESPHPMDRLLCGDVGYGKTEVAFRAAFKAILSGKQVALLCPTTILSNQHYQNALERFKSFPVNIELLNRFVSPSKVSRIVKNIKEGKVDFVIGTHKLLNDNVEFKNLGLLIIDEEQRFGVTHKEKIKKMRNNVDVLTLSATPIPRTLQMSLSGIRGLSTIETPPNNRYPVQTYVLSYNKKVIKDAIYKELSRNGQVFLLYNHIDNMPSKVEEIKSLVPDAKVGYAHGQMSRQELEDIMLHFVNKDYDVLVCTTIIETGIDIPNVNTLIIIDADRFGLSQLYQLRGRVGRTNKVAYCYLMYDQSKILGEVAIKRLAAIKEFTELGSGFAIAMRDLSIRGAGDILGSEQAGFVDSVGIELFMEMLRQEIDKLKGIDAPEQEDTQPLIDVSTSIKDTYVDDEQLKLEIHKKINEIDTKEKLEIVKTELEDRFGKIDNELLIYMYEEWFEKLAADLGINRIRQSRETIEITLNKELMNAINGEQLFVDIIKLSSKFKFKTFAGLLTIVFNIKDLDKHFIFYLIDLLFIIKKAI